MLRLSPKTAFYGILAGSMKIFCIGLSKTGTTSLAGALTMLGYRTIDNMGASEYRSGDIGCLDIATIDANDAFTDTPIPSFYRQLDQHYPGSKFILTVRDIDPWLKSSKKQFNSRGAEQRNQATNQILEEIYGSPIFEEALFRSGYQHFIDQAKDYFSERPHDLLVIDITKGQTWATLCRFLDKPVPAVPFPKANVTRISWTPPEQLLDIVLRAGDTSLEIFNALNGKNLPGASPAWHNALPETVRRLFQRLRSPARGDADKAAKTASRLVLEQIESDLRRATPDIPIVSPDTKLDAIEGHQNWNHFWLVAPLDGIEHFADPDAMYSINIALIQDRVPITGIIHAPTLATSYYAASWRPSLKAVRGILLSDNAIEADRKRLPAMTAQERKAALSLQSPSDSVPIAAGLRLCLATFAASDTAGHLEHSKEWQTAAAQCILNAIGFRLAEPGATAALSYNKPSFRNPPIDLHSAD